MKETIKSAKNILNLYNSPVTRKNFNNEVDRKTKEYQKKYGFEISNDPKHPTWNNEADAFKHAYMSAMLSLRYDEATSKVAGLNHEWENRQAKNPKEETNMDLLNNKDGYEIAREVREELKLLKGNIPDKMIEDLVAQKIMDRMNKGGLVTHPDDPRSKTIPQKIEDAIKGKETGKASDIEKKFTREEIANMTPEEFAKNEKEIMRQMANGEIKDSKPDYQNYQNSNSGNGKIYTREEIGKMSSEEFQKHEKEIEKQMKEIGIPTEAEVKDIQPKEDSWQKKPDIVKTNHANDDSVTGYIWVASPGSCDACQALDGQVFESEDDIPPIPHPNCNCTVERVIENKNQNENDEDDEDENDEDSEDDYNNDPTSYKRNKYNRQNPMLFNFLNNI